MMEEYDKRADAWMSDVARRLGLKGPHEVPTTYYNYDPWGCFDSEMSSKEFARLVKAKTPLDAAHDVLAFYSSACADMAMSHNSEDLSQECAESDLQADRLFDDPDVFNDVVGQRLYDKFGWNAGLHNEVVDELRKLRPGLRVDWDRLRLS